MIPSISFLFHINSIPLKPVQNRRRIISLPFTTSYMDHCPVTTHKPFYDIFMNLISVSNWLQNYIITLRTLRCVQQLALCGAAGPPSSSHHHITSWISDTFSSPQYYYLLLGNKQRLIGYYNLIPASAAAADDHHHVQLMTIHDEDKAVQRLTTAVAPKRHKIPTLFKTHTQYAFQVTAFTKPTLMLSKVNSLPIEVGIQTSISRDCTRRKHKLCK